MLWVIFQLSYIINILSNSSFLDDIIEQPVQPLQQQVAERVARALPLIGLGERDPLVRAAQDMRFGDYQSNIALSLAKELGRKPRDIAEDIVAALGEDDLFEAPQVAGPGFINLKLKPNALATMLGDVRDRPTRGADRMGIEPASSSQVVVVDFSSPNLAKEMHVGHLRSTVIGDCIARVLEFQGHTVHRENHVGDWGTQFGMLVAYLHATEPIVVERPEAIQIADLETFYVAAKTRFDEDAAFQREARDTVVRLQRGDAQTRQIWKAFCDESLRHCHEIYDRLDVELEDRGESVYAARMEDVVSRLGSLEQRGEAGVRESDGALCVFIDGYTNRDGEPLPLIARKSDGGHNYATSDLATIVERLETLGAERIIYVVGMAQKQHLEMVFAAARQVGWVPDSVSLEHLGFGNMLSSSGKPFKTREGGTVKLKSLLDEAVSRAKDIVLQQQDKERAFSASEIDDIAERVGLAAVKYFDLSHALQTDYKFDPDVMLAMDGNTAPYVLYAYARIRSIGRRAGIDMSRTSANTPVVLEHPSEIALAKKLLQLADVLQAVGRDLRPIVLVDYLYELAKTFSRFYDRNQGVRVIDASPESLRRSRLRLCDLTARTLELGLNLLGIETIEQM